MKILHYFLGFPPYRSGGLTKYVSDLMEAQAGEGHKVMALWPGQMRMISKKTSVKKRKSISGIENYELVNPLPVSLDEGITAFAEYERRCDRQIYVSFLKETMPDAIHIHTLMGVHREFIEAASELNIRTVFTTHDYFGICPKVNLYRYGVTCENDHDCQDCIQCNVKALSIKKIRIIQSPMYRLAKNTVLVRYFRKKHRSNFFSFESIPDMPVEKSQIPVLAEEYRKLREYYISILSMIDFVHFNSRLTESVYKRYFIPKDSKVMTITHRNIADNRKTNYWSPKDIMRITVLAPAKPFKGFNILKDALDELWNSGVKNFELKIFDSVQDKSKYMKIQEEGFSYDQLGDILADTDVVIAPSVWYETFGFTVLEAISYGVPVIVSDHVGAKDIIGAGGIVVKAGSKESLKAAILSLSPDRLRELRDAIQKEAKIKTWEQFLKENNQLYFG